MPSQNKTSEKQYYDLVRAKLVKAEKSGFTDSSKEAILEKAKAISYTNQRKIK